MKDETLSVSRIISLEFHLSREKQSIKEKRSASQGNQFYNRKKEDRIR